MSQFIFNNPARVLFGERGFVLRCEKNYDKIWFMNDIGAKNGFTFGPAVFPDLAANRSAARQNSHETGYQKMLRTEREGIGNGSGFQEGAHKIH